MKSCENDTYLKTEKTVQKWDLISKTDITKNNQRGKDAELGKMCKSKEEAGYAEEELLHKYRIWNTEIVHILVFSTS